MKFSSSSLEHFNTVMTSLPRYARSDHLMLMPNFLISALPNTLSGTFTVVVQRKHNYSHAHRRECADYPAPAVRNVTAMQCVLRILLWQLRRVSNFGPTQTNINNSTHLTTSYGVRCTHHSQHAQAHIAWGRKVARERKKTTANKQWRFSI